MIFAPEMKYKFNDIVVTIDGEPVNINTTTTVWYTPTKYWLRRAEMQRRIANRRGTWVDPSTFKHSIQ